MEAGELTVGIVWLALITLLFPIFAWSFAWLVKFLFTL
jgi:hypothetical protein